MVTKFDPGDKLWVIANDKIQHLPIRTIQIGTDKTIYYTVATGEFSSKNIIEDDAFITKEELIASL